MKDWNYWLSKTAKFYGTPRDTILSQRGKTREKSTFYWLVFKAGLDLEKTSISIGKDRTTIVKYISRNAKNENDKFRDKSAEDYIINKSK
jgi:hypothetical protein